MFISSARIVKMKSKLIEVEEKKQEIKFPCLVKYSGHENCYSFVVMFSSEYCGTVVWVKDHYPYKLGYYMERWESIENTNTWEILPPGTKVEIEQGY
jgi:hypothetical protein